MTEYSCAQGSVEDSWYLFLHLPVCNRKRDVGPSRGSSRRCDRTGRRGRTTHWWVKTHPDIATPRSGAAWPQRRAPCKKLRCLSRLALPNAIPANGAGPPEAATSQSSSDPVIQATPRLRPVGSSSDHTRRKERPGASFASSWMSSSGTLPPITARYTNSGTACGGHVSGAAAMATGS